MAPEGETDCVYDLDVSVPPAIRPDEGDREVWCADERPQEPSELDADKGVDRKPQSPKGFSIPISSPSRADACSMGTECDRRLLLLELTKFPGRSSAAFLIPRPPPFCRIPTMLS